jgi:DNA primase
LAGIDFPLLRSQLRIAAVLELIGYEPAVKAADQWRGPCPIHQSTSSSSRSFSVNTRRHLYRCFKCGSAGNAVDLWMALTKQGVFAASVELCQRLGLSIPRKEARHPSAEQK